MARRITFLRHGNSVAPEGAPDKARRLSDKGRQQAQKRREQLGNPEFDLIITSQVIRTTETALEVAGEDNTAPMVALYELFTPHCGPQHDALDRLFKKLGHKTLSAYFADDPSDVAQMKQFGSNSWQVIMAAISAKDEDWIVDDVLVLGHGMYSALMAHCASAEHGECLLNLTTGECDGFIVEMDDEDDEKIASITPLPPLE